MKLRVSIPVLSSILSIISMSPKVLCMEYISIDEAQKVALVQWIKERIQPLNAGRFKSKSKGAKSNCTLIAEKCVKVLAGLEQPALVPARKKNLDITFRVDENNTIVSHVVNRREQAELVPYQEFTETIDLLDSETLGTTNVDLTQASQRDSVKYIMSIRSRIREDIQSLPGSAESCGEDKTLTGLIYYYYKDVDAGHLANFFRDSAGTVFFVDAQSEEITQTVPERILDYELKEEIFFYPLTPKSGYYIKKELANLFIKEEPLLSQVQEREKQTANTVSYNNQDLGTSYEGSISVLNYLHRQNSAKTYACDYEGCGKVFAHSGHLTTHKRTHTGEKPFVCDYEGCGKAFAHSGDLTRHKRTHTGEKPFVCDYEGCDKAFATSSQLTKHKRTHTGEKPFVCDYEGCDKAFAQSGQLTTHKKTHTGEKPHVCDYEGCGKAFSQSSQLTRHKRTHTGEKPFVCDYEGCDKAFAQSGQLTTHKKTHTGEKPHVCDYEGCGKAFSHSGDLTKHKRTHTGEKPYVCDCEGCDKAFATSSQLTKHKRTHTREKPHVCDYEGCDKAFASSSDLTKHKRTHDDGDSSPSTSNKSKKQKISRS